MNYFIILFGCICKYRSGTFYKIEKYVIFPEIFYFKVIEAQADFVFFMYKLGKNGNMDPDFQTHVNNWKMNVFR